LLERLRRKESRVHVAIGPVCNNNCLFCMEEDREGRKAINGALLPEHVRSILIEHRGAREVCFTSGEPTLVEQLPRYVAWAREFGYPRVSVTTNGRRLAYRPYCARLVSSGVNRFYISIHGHTRQLHDGLARTPGAFDQSIAGLDHAVSFGRKGVDVHTSTVVTKRNLPDLGRIYSLLRGRGAHQVVFNAMQANGRAHTHFDRVFPRYRDLVAAFISMLDGIDETRPPVFLVDVPPCVTETVPAFHRGWVEAYVHHEVADRGPQSYADDVPRRASSDARLVERRRADFDSARRTKRAECTGCQYDAVCEGVWNNYLSRFGWDEFQPVSGSVTDQPASGR
jgi:MoaA/NifB/PqqE/SkfB family radical SAM enzyme